MGISSKKNVIFADMRLKCNKTTGMKLMVALSFVCYLYASIYSPYYYDNATELYYADGLFNFFFGWTAFIFPETFMKLYSLAWFSNVTYIIAVWYLIKNNKKRFLLWIFITFFLSCALIFCPKTAVDEWDILHNYTLTAGFYLKMLSFIMLLITGTIYFKSKAN